MTPTTLFALTLSCGLVLGGLVGFHIGRFVEGLRWARRHPLFARELAKEMKRRRFALRPRKEHIQSHISN